MKKNVLIVCITVIITIICCAIIFYLGFNIGIDNSKITTKISNDEKKEMEKFLGNWKYKGGNSELSDEQIRILNSHEIKIADLNYHINSTSSFGDWSILENNGRLLIVFPFNMFGKDLTFKVGTFKINNNTPNKLVQIETIDEDLQFIYEFNKKYFSISNDKLEKLPNYNIEYEK